MDTVKTEQVNLENLHDCFQYQPWDSEQTTIGTKVREALEAAARVILENVPPCADRTVAIRKLREARMDANSAISFKGRF